MQEGGDFSDSINKKNLLNSFTNNILIRLAIHKLKNLKNLRLSKFLVWVVRH